MTTTGAATAGPTAPGPWAPFRQGTFAALWAAQLGSNIGTYMQSVGAQWYLVDETDSAALVAWVQAASLLPVLLLGLVAGVIADLFDRRRLLIVMTALSTAAAGVLWVVTVLHELTPASLLAFTFVLGVLSALTGPAWQAIQPELVPRDEIPAAASLSSVTANGARAIGPALAGAVISLAGVGPVFAVNAVSFVGVTIVLLRWRRPSPPPSSLGREPFGEAVMAGIRYVVHAPGVRRILLRAGLFGLPVSAFWALLPVAASQIFALPAWGYGAMLGALGVGAVLGVVVMPALQRLPATAMLAGATAVFAVGTAATAYAPLPLAFALFIPMGIAWIAVLTTLNAALQLTAAAWVRARTAAIYLMVFIGGQGLGSLGWGVVAGRIGVVATLGIAAAATLLVAAVGVALPLRSRGATLDRTVVSLASGEPQLLFDPPPTDPVEVVNRYDVAGDPTGFLDAMRHVSLSRGRTGATRWSLARSGEHAGHFYERFAFPSWSDYRRGDEERWTGSDVAGLSDVAPMLLDTQYLFPVAVPRHPVPPTPVPAGPPTATTPTTPPPTASPNGA